MRGTRWGWLTRSCRGRRGPSRSLPRNAVFVTRRFREIRAWCRPKQRVCRRRARKKQYRVLYLYAYYSRKADDFRSLSTLRCCLFGHATRFVFLCIDHFGQLISRGEEKCIGKLLPCSAPRGTSRERIVIGIDPLRSNTRAPSSWANCSLSIIIKSYPRVDYVCCA